MKNSLKAGALFLALLTIAGLNACKKNSSTPTPDPGPVYNVKQVNLVSDQATVGAAHVDTNIVNAWGLTVNGTGTVWLSSNRKGSSPIYDKTGLAPRIPVTITPNVAGNTGNPTGIVFNSSTSFAGNKFIFASQDGSITAWITGNVAQKVASQAGAGYTGLALAADGGANFLYAANFKAGKVDVYDSNFALVTTKPFTDATIPAGFAPFNIQVIGTLLYVTYAKQSATGSVAGAGNGYVNIFTTAGVLVKRFVSQGYLNSPWGVALAPAGFADVQESILIGNFGDGHINVFDANGNYLRQLQSNGQPLTIDGLWAIDFLKGNVSGTGSSTDLLYFTAGPGGGTHGLFGSLQLQ